MPLMIEPTAARYLEFIIHGFFNGLTTLKQKLLDSENLSDEDLETLYALGYYLFTYGKYEDAKDIFTGLTAYSPYTAYFWRALGAVNQQVKDYDEAIAAYDMAIANDPGDVVSYVYRAESKFLSGKKEDGLTDLRNVLEIGANKPHFSSWVQRAELLISLQEPEEVYEEAEEEDLEEV